MSKIPSKRVPPSPSKVAFRPRQVTTNPQQRKSLYTSFKIGDRVITSEKTGTIAFIGTTKFAEGEWIGINLDEPQGKNDGSHGGVRYFETDANHGLFCRPDNVQHLSINGSLQRNSQYNPSRQSAIEGASNNVLGITTIDKQDLSSTKNLQIGDRVIVRGEKFGILKYIGKIHLDEGIWCGIKLDGPLGKHDGKVGGVRYFRCPHRFGLFASLNQVEKILPDPREARQSIVSTDSNSHNRDSPSQDSNLSEFSLSSDSNNQFPTRSPRTSRQTSLTTDLTPMETSLSSQVAHLLERIKEKDLLIKNLEQQTEKDRSEDFRMAEKINEMEKHMIQLQQQYETTENENLNLIKEQFELKQRLDVLQDTDDYFVLSPDEVQRYEKNKENVLELESINQKLTQENQRLQEELKRYYQLNEQITDLQNREQFLKIQLTEKETFYQQQIEEYRTKMEDLLNELKRYKESIVPDLENQNHVTSNGREGDYETLKQQLTEFQEQDRTQNVILNERIAQYEIERKQYQMKIDEDNHQIQKLLDELKSLHDEKTSQEEQLKQTIVTLKQSEQQLQMDIDELNDRERKASKTLHQHDARFDQQISEYEEKLEQADLQKQQLQSELEKLQEEKTNFNDTLNTLTHDLETLKTELQNRDRNESTIFTEYKSKTDQSLLEIQNLQSKLKILEDEKTTMENELNNTIDTLKQEFEKHQNQRESEFEQQIKDYREKLEETNPRIEHLQSELESLQDEKSKYLDTIDALGQELQALKTELQDRDNTQNATINDLDIHYQSQLKNLREEKTTMENSLTERIVILKQDYEKLHDEQKQKEKSIQAQYEQEFDEYQKNLELSIHRMADIQSELVNLQEGKESNEKLLNEKIDSLKIDYEKQIQILKTQKIDLQQQNRAQEERLKEYESTMDETNELFQRVEDITRVNERLKKELEDLKTANDPKEMEELHKQVTVLQQMHLNLLEKQATKEQEYVEAKQIQEKIFQGKIDEYEMRIAMLKSEHMVEMENIKLDHDQEVLRFKAQIAKLTKR